MILPEPIYTPSDPKKKLHAKKQPKGHIPRPRNAFILFRCDFVRQKTIPTEVEKDHRNISRIVGQIWRQMDDKQKEPWVLMAEREKMAHSKLYPGYKFPTGGVSNKKSKRGDDIPHETQKPDSEDHHFGDNSDFLHLFRSSSSPPVALHVPHANSERCNGYGAPLETHDDMARLPSQATFYQSTSHQPKFPLNTESFTDMNSQHYFAEFTQEDYSKAVANQEYYTTPEVKEPKGFPPYIPKENLESKFCGPRMSTHPYLTPPGQNDPPEWDVAPTQPHTWADWKAFQFDQSSANNGIFGECNLNLAGPNALPYIPRYYHSDVSNDPLWDSDYHDSTGEQQISSRSFSSLPEDFCPAF